MEVLGYILVIWIAIIVVAFINVILGKWHEKAKLFLYWSLFPFPLIFHPKRFGIVKSWILFLISPCMMSVYFIGLAIMFLSAVFETEEGVPDSIPYHTNADLRRITGVDFPIVIPVDSFYQYDWNISVNSAKFIPQKVLERQFFHSLDMACKTDSCCWSKDSSGYRYYIHPERPIDRPSGTHVRKVEFDGKMIDDWQGDFVEVRIPVRGDTIYVNEGWCR